MTGLPSIGDTRTMEPVNDPFADPATVAESHISMLVLTHDRVFKFRKPVKTGFCDFSTLDARRDDCEREVAVNSRLSPDVYLGVASVAPPGEPPERGEPCVVMRRLPAARQLSALLGGDEDMHEALRDVARHIARFHMTATRGPEISEQGSARAVQSLWRASLVDLQRFTGQVLDSAVLGEVAVLAERWLQGRERLYRNRGRDGYIVDGHGDLRAENIFCMDDGPRILDAIQFDDRLRWVDVATDIGFLIMDLRRGGRTHDAERFVRAYEDLTGEPLPGPLLDHAVAYWAVVRAKVACLRWEQGSAKAADEARHLLGLALDTLQVARPRLVLVGGLPGTGKSTVADGISVDNDWTVLSSDVVRKELAGLPADVDAAAAFDDGIYRSEHTSATYRELLRRAHVSLELGESIILDASWSSLTWRQGAAEVAYATGSDLIELRCVLDDAVAHARMERRAAIGGASSDADASVAALMAERFDPWPEAVAIDTGGSPSATIREAVALVS